MGADTFQAFSKDAEVPDIIVFVFDHVYGDVACSHFAKYPSDILNCFSQAAADLMYGFCNHADFICPAIEWFQLLVSR